MTDPGNADSPSDPGKTDAPAASSGGPVHVHLHLAVAGAFPLRVADVLFTGDGVVIPEYEYLTPLFGVARSGVAEAGERARDRYREAGVPGLAGAAEQVHRLSYEDVAAVRLYHSWATRPKVAVVTEAGPPYAYRLHAPVDLDALAAALRSLGDRRGFAAERRAGVGYSPLASVRRFVAGR